MTEKQTYNLSWALKGFWTFLGTLFVTFFIWMFSMIHTMYDHVLLQPGVDKAQNEEISDLKSAQTNRVELLTLVVTNKIQEANEQFARIDSFFNTDYEK